MSAFRPSTSGRDASSWCIGLVPLLSSFVSAGAVQALHGHACTGDACMLCLAAAWAHALLAVSLGALLIRPILRLVSRLRVVRLTMRLSWEPRSSAFVDARSTRVEMNPVTMGVRLLI